ncbi:fibroin light chain-like [Pieris brassicae]|uniref:Fibroin light chain n=1 Tax=Pieris brassicae TaxID=7116 RepID=A0A9P0TP10_PIEBR|nr:fibroin light chain-like [Pieris brassicae]CAH4035017.1 unnamed protein product [Pieris brassicae]
MLPFVLVLLAAQSAFAAPSNAAVTFYNTNEVGSVPDNGGLVNSYIVSGPVDYLDGGSIPLYAQMLLQILNDLANSPNPVNKATAVIQTIAALGELSHGTSGDSCEAAGLINAYAYSAKSGNNSGLRQAIANFVARLSNNIDTIAQLIVNPNAVRYSVGPRGSCIGGGRTYQFEESWDAILNNAAPAQSALLNEEYCVSRRMYNAFNIRSNNVAAGVSAAAIPQVTEVAKYAMQPLAQFLRAVASGVNPLQEAAAAKAGLLQAVNKIKL